MMDWTDVKLVATIIAGVIVSTLLSTAATWRVRLSSIIAGAFIAVIFTGPLIKWLELEFSTYQYAVAGFLAMSGDRLARRAFDIIDKAPLPPWGGKS
jgi:hypothetical protein